MTTEITPFQVYIIATAVSSAIWLTYVIFYTGRAFKRLDLVNRDPFLRHAIRGSRYIAMAELFGMLLVSIVFMWRNALGLPILLDLAPKSLQLLLFVQYATVYIMATAPATLLYMHVVKLDEIEREKRERKDETP